MLIDAAKIHPDNGEVTALKSDVAAAIGVLDAVYEIKDWTPIADLSQQVTGALSITRAVVGGSNAYFLDVQGPPRAAAAARRQDAAGDDPPGRCARRIR